MIMAVPVVMMLLAVGAVLVRTGQVLARLEHPSIARLLDGGVLPDGVVACSDLLALQAVQAVRAAGLRVPQDVAVVGYDDMPLATYSSPPLTTVHQPVDRAGVEIVEALLDQLSGARVPSRTLDVHLVLRDSAP
jgi:DNA-binding LacI/PurR family transcriptional regulator